MSAPGHSSFFSDFAQKRELWWQFTVRAVEMRHRGSYLGISWSVLNPLLMLAVYVVVFGKIFQSRFNVLPNETPADFVLAMFLGLTVFQLLAESTAVSPTVVITNPNLVKKVVFPLEVLPLSQLGAFWFHFLISLGLVIVGAVFFGRGVSVASLAWLPVIFLPLLLLSVGLGWMLAALGVFFRDVTQVIPFLTQIALYASAILYPINRIPPSIWTILRWNPLLHTVDLARNALLWDRPINLLHLGYTYVWGIVVCLLGGWIFRKLQPAFADVI